MKRGRFTESQIIKILTEQDKVSAVLDICREHKIGQPTFYQWKNKYSGMDINQLKQMKDMEKELAQYKKVVAELSLQNTILKDVIKKKH